jgi:MFS family permease
MSKNGSALETAPLLADEQAPSDYDDRYQSQYRQRVLILVCISIVAADFGSYMAYAPQIAVFESLICRQHNGGEALGSLARNTTSPCKTPGVQGELALINGWKDTVDQVPGIALALPYGFLADRVGRKPVLLLSLAGLLLEEIAVRVIAWSYVVIPLRTVWAVPIFQLLGGGPQVANSMAYAMVSDLYPADKRCLLRNLL